MAANWRSGGRWREESFLSQGMAYELPWSAIPSSLPVVGNLAVAGDAHAAVAVPTPTVAKFCKKNELSSNYASDALAHILVGKNSYYQLKLFNIQLGHSLFKVSILICKEYLTLFTKIALDNQKGFVRIWKRCVMIN